MQEEQRNNCGCGNSGGILGGMFGKRGCCCGGNSEVLFFLIVFLLLFIFVIIFESSYIGNFITNLLRIEI